MPSIIIIKSLQVFTPKIVICSSRDNLGDDYNVHYLTLVSQRGAVRDAPDYFEQLTIYYHNPATGETSTYTPIDLGKCYFTLITTR